MEEDLCTFELYKMLKTVTDIFDRYNIKYWADGGTFLGAIRHNGIIPWDDDVDLGVVDNISDKKFNLFKNAIENKGYGIVKQDFGYKIFPNNGDKIKINPWSKHYNKIKKKYKTISRSQLFKVACKTYEKPHKEIYHKYRYPFLDIFEYKNIDNKLFTKGDASWWTDTCYYDPMKLNNLKKTKFGNFRIYTMPDYNRYFNSCYGKDWNNYGYTSGWDHRREKHSRKNMKKITLTPKQRQPKKPFI